MLSLDGLRESVSNGDIDTVIVAVTDMQGRLQGKRFHARHFLADVVAHGTEGCNYLLAVDVDMNLRRKKLFLFAPERMALSIDRLRHYTGTRAELFQRYALLTKYAWHIEGFRA